MYWTGAPCRCIWPPPWPQACPETSRSLRKAAGRTVDFETELLAYAADRLTQVLWWLHNDTSKPPSVLADLRGEADTSNVQCYASAEEFDAALAALKGG